MERPKSIVGDVRIEADDLPKAIRAGKPVPFHGAAPDPRSDQSLSDLERARILDVLDSCGGNKKLAASRLGIHRSTLYAKLDRYGMR
jgi:transcriptional regulator of acetoin/glycerol metabolism